MIKHIFVLNPYIDRIDLCQICNLSKLNDIHQPISIHPLQKEKLAKRDKVSYRYDVLYWNFIHAMAEIGHFGAEKYGNLNYRQPGLTRGKSPINHIANHLRNYIEDIEYDHTEVGNQKKYHLAAIAFNAMMEFYYEDQRTKEPNASTTKEV